MRTRKEIEEDTNESGGKIPVGYVGDQRIEMDVPRLSIERASLEVLLDVRELLSHPPHSRPATEEEAAAFLEMFTPVSEKAGVPFGCCKDCAYYLDYKNDWQCNGGVDGGNCKCHPDFKKDSVEESMGLANPPD